MNFDPRLRTALFPMSSATIQHIGGSVLELTGLGIKLHNGQESLLLAAAMI